MRPQNELKHILENKRKDILRQLNFILNSNLCIDTAQEQIYALFDEAFKELSDKGIAIPADAFNALGKIKESFALFNLKYTASVKSRILTNTIHTEYALKKTDSPCDKKDTSLMKKYDDSIKIFCRQTAESALSDIENSKIFLRNSILEINKEIFELLNNTLNLT